MVYRDDSDPPIGHQPLPYDPWDYNGIQPAPPADDERQAILMAMERRPNHGPSRLKSDLKRDGLDVSLEVICGVKAGL
jgi:hypothetical protein